MDGASGAADEKIRALVARLSRADARGGATIERAAIMADGTRLETVVQWILDHDGHPEERPAGKRGGRGLHAARLAAAASTERPPLRYRIPAAALVAPPAAAESPED
jgi:hypothetical protein